MFMKNFLNGKICLILVITLKIQSFLKDSKFIEFKDVLFNKKIIRHKVKKIQAKKHKIGTYEIDKISLSCFDDKRQVLDDGVHTLAYFHKDSHKFKKDCQLKKNTK